MKQIPVMRTRYARRFARTLERLGASASPSLEHCHIDPHVIGVDDGYMPVRQLYDFVCHAVERTGITVLGLETGINPRQRHSDFSEEVAAAPTLTRSLESIIENEKSEDATADFSLEHKRASTWLCGGSIDGPTEAIRQVELYRYAALLEVIRYAAGPTWLPRRLLLQQVDNGTLPEHRLLRNVDVAFGASRLAIEIPEELLDHSLRSGASMRRLKRRRAAGHLKAPLSFESAATELVRTNMLGGRYKLQDLSDVLGMSERSLQRQLAWHDLSFAQILEQTRMEAARSMLSGSERLADIATALGYRHSTHFSRAFKRACNTTPRQYRAGQLQ